MTAEVAPALAEALLRHPGLVALNLNDTSLTDEGVSAVVQALHGSVGSLQVCLVAPHQHDVLDFYFITELKKRSRPRACVTTKHCGPHVLAHHSKLHKQHLMVMFRRHRRSYSWR